jgi:predicted membrane protein
MNHNTDLIIVLTLVGIFFAVLFSTMTLLSLKGHSRKKKAAEIKGLDDTITIEIYPCYRTSRHRL